MPLGIISLTSLDIDSSNETMVNEIRDLMTKDGLRTNRFTMIGSTDALEICEPSRKEDRPGAATKGESIILTQQ